MKIIKLINSTKNPLIEFCVGKSLYRFTPFGDQYTFMYEAFMLNSCRGNGVYGSTNNIYLRIFNDKAPLSPPAFYPLLGVSSNSSLKRTHNGLLYKGVADGVHYSVNFICCEGAWLWEVTLEGYEKTVDIIYGQDIGVADKGAVFSNELYTSQYLGHSIFETENGFAVCSRQNMAMSGERFPYIQQGMIKGSCVGYSTDATQFFGLSYKATHIPQALLSSLPNVNYQFELSYIALQSQKVKLNGVETMIFYGLFVDDYPSAITSPISVDALITTYTNINDEKEHAETLPKWSVRNDLGAAYTSPYMSEEELVSLFPERTLEERDKQTSELLSFFTAAHSHVVTQKKETLSERPHGVILSSAVDAEVINSEVVTSTNFMYGLFGAHIVIGNTSFHKLLSRPQGLLNLLKYGGQRIYVKIGGVYRILALPAVYEIGLNHCRWLYKLPENNDILTISSFVTSLDCVLTVKSEKNIGYDFILTNQIDLGDIEFESTFEMEELFDGKVIRLRQNADKRSISPYPHLHYDLEVQGAAFSLSDDRIFYEDDAPPLNNSLLTFCIANTNTFTLQIRCRLNEEEPSIGNVHDLSEAVDLHMRYMEKLNGGFKLSLEGSDSERIQILNETAYWYTHNAMIHYAMPHGLEQPGGAAWGSRDICQGPFEFFYATQNFTLLRSILIRVFENQNAETGEWPQWFMFDGYKLDAGECHGDVVFWPLKITADYLRATNDLSVLDADTGGFTLFMRIRQSIKSINGRFIGDTGLITYAGGDWDDTLQPADEELKNKLVSSWTMALAYQTLDTLSQTLEIFDSEFSGFLKQMAQRIFVAFNGLIPKEGDIIPGFVKCEGEQLTYMLHPLDSETGIHYRLLPMTRSIIAQLVSRTAAEKSCRVISEHLTFPDGIRLMNRPAAYNGGVSRLFRRAEQAANVGREISLQYTHAHIRFIEAMAKLGKAESAWNGLFTINPILIQKTVDNAALRQSNLYFSSSEGYFTDRYDYSRNFNKLKDGSIPVKGGWRLYSSGPGIYLNQLITNLLGLRTENQMLVIDPVLPKRLDGLKLQFSIAGKVRIFVYHIKDEQEKVTVIQNGKIIVGESVHNPYRTGGVRIPFEALTENGEIEIYTQGY